MSRTLTKQTTTVTSRLTPRARRCEAQLALVTERYMRSSEKNEASEVEAELVDTKMKLAQACSRRDVLSMSLRRCEKDYVELKLELAAAKQEADDQVFMNAVLKNGCEKLEEEVEALRGGGGGGGRTCSGPAARPSRNSWRRRRSRS